MMSPKFNRATFALAVLAAGLAGGRFEQIRNAVINTTTENCYMMEEANGSVHYCGDRHYSVEWSDVSGHVVLGVLVTIAVAILIPLSFSSFAWSLRSGIHSGFALPVKSGTVFALVLAILLAMPNFFL